MSDDAERPAMHVASHACSPPNMRAGVARRIGMIGRLRSRLRNGLRGSRPRPRGRRFECALAAISREGPTQADRADHRALHRHRPRLCEGKARKAEELRAAFSLRTHEGPEPVDDHAAYGWSASFLH